MIKFIAPLREKRKSLAQNKDHVYDVLKRGGEKAKKIASIKMNEVRKRIGTDIY